MIPRRLAYVVNVFPKISETFIAHELAELRRRGVSLLVLPLRPPTETLRHEFVAQAGLDTLCCREPEAFEARLREFRPQLLHAHFATEPAAAAREWAARLGVPFTFTAHGYDLHRKPPPDFAERAAAARAVVTVSQANFRHITETWRVPPTRIRVIPCGVDTDLFCPAAPAPVPDGPPLLLSVARHVPVKNLGLLLRACAILRDRGVAFRGVSVGDGPARAELEGLRTRLGLQHCLQFVGAAEQGEVLRWWRRAALAVLTSEHEGMPVCLMEAAACRVPTVATAVGGVPELIEDGVTGLLTPPGDEEALAGALQSLLEEPARRAALGAAARRRAVERFSLGRQVDQLLDLWTEVMG